MRRGTGKPWCNGGGEAMEIDKLVIEILEDGTIKTTTDEVGTANHDNAEQFLRAMARLAGGDTTRRRRTKAKTGHAHTHSQGHIHHQS
jgi:hypothetical protein